MSYKGKEVCQGCGSPGTEKPRLDKNSLCYACHELMRAGSAAMVERSIEYTRVLLHVHAYYSSELNIAAHELMRSIDNPGGNVKATVSFKNCSGSNAYRYTIDSRLVAPIERLFKNIDDRYWKLKEELDKIPRKAAEEVERQRDVIFNEGVKYGKSLLARLNSGEITLGELDKNFSYLQSVKSND